MLSEELDVVYVSCVLQSPSPGCPTPSWELDTPELFASSHARNQSECMLRCVKALRDIYILTFSNVGVGKLFP